MANQLFANNATTTTRGFISTTTTSIVVNSSSGFPNPTGGDYFLVTLDGGGNSFEIVKVTAVVGTNWTIVRAQEGTTAQLWQPNSRIECRVTKGTLDNLRNIEINAAAFGIVADGITDDSVALNTLIVNAPTTSIIYLTGNIKVNSSIIMKSGITILCKGSIIAGSQLKIIDFTNVSDSEWNGGTITGDATTLGQDGFELNNANRNRLIGMTITGCKNKAISVSAQSSLGQLAKDNYLAPVKISGSTSTTGAGISLFGDTCTHNYIEGGFYTANRIGITINGSHYNTVIGIDCSNNTDSGLTIDGIITNSGDGGKYNKILSPVCNNTSPSISFAGIYLGNGSSFNEIIAASCKGNAGAGLRITATQGINDCFSNQIIGAVLENNATSGLVLSAATSTQVIQTVTNNNTGRGVSIFRSDYTLISQLEARGNSQQGVLIQSGYTKVTGGGRLSNNDVGYQVAAGGSTDSTNNLIDGYHVISNTTSDFNIAAGLGRYANCTGNPPDVRGDAGDANFTVAAGTAKTIIYNTPLTALRSVILATGGSTSGDTAHIIRTANATGAFALNVGTGPLKALSAGQWCEVTYNGTAWVLTSFGSL